MTAESAHKTFSDLVAKLAEELPGITFGYIGNVGVFRGSGPYDDRSWRIFLPSSGPLGYGDMVVIGATADLEARLKDWPTIEKLARNRYAAKDRK